MSLSSLNSISPPGGAGDALLTRKQGQGFLGLSDASWWRLLKDDPSFPSPIWLGTKQGRGATARYWRSELIRYVESKKRSAAPTQS